MEVHHENYKRIYQERVEDVSILCTRCHKIVHNEIDYQKEIDTYENAFDTWAAKVYGEDYMLHYDIDVLGEEFDDWIVRKEDEEYR